MDRNKRIWYKWMTTMLLILFFLGAIIYEKAFAIAEGRPEIFNVGLSVSPESFNPFKGEQCVITGSIRKLESSEWLWGDMLPEWDIVSYSWFISITRLSSSSPSVKRWSGSGTSVTSSWTTFATANWDGRDDNGQLVPAGEYRCHIMVLATYTPEVPWDVLDDRGVERIVTVEKPEIFIGYHHKDPKGNDKYITPLEDYTLLTNQDIIVVAVIAEDKNPSVRDTIELKVYVEGDETNEVTIMAKESGENTGIYYNYNPADGYDPMYDSPLRIDTTPGIDCLKLNGEDEEIVAYIPDEPEERGTITLDLAEVGIGWIQNYEHCIFKEFLNRTKENAEYIYDTLVGKDWIASFNNENSNCKESQYDISGDSDTDGVDTVDFAVWAGHGPYGDYEDGDLWPEPALHFYKEPHFDTYPRSDDVDLYRSEVAWGDDDLDWICLFTCNFLKDPESGEFHQIGNGVQMVCGFKDTMRMLPQRWMVETFIKLITRPNNPWTIKDAWLKMASYEHPTNPDWTQIGTGVVVFDKRAADDHLPGFGSYAQGHTFTLNAFKEEKKK